MKAFFHFGDTLFLPCLGLPDCIGKTQARQTIDTNLQIRYDLKEKFLATSSEKHYLLQNNTLQSSLRFPN
jgi:hypothetical protein